MLYQFLSSTLLPAYLKRKIRVRLAAGKENADRLEERYGISTLPRPSGPLVWIHAASVGESLSVLALITRLQKAFPKVTVLITTGTVTSAKILEGKLSAGVIHQFIPFDVPRWVVNFLNHWKPDLAVWVESELWPNLVFETWKKKIPLILINGRISDKSYDRWRFFKSFIQDILGKFDLCLAQSGEQAQRFETLGAPNVHVTGNIKFAASPLESDPQALQQLKTALNGRTVWLAASTHPGEEEIVARAHKILKQTFPDLLTILIPRHPDRRTKISESLAPLKVSLRSKGQDITPETDIYLGDTLGELGLFYGLVPIAFVGGSLVPKGGHNLIEPAQLGCAILHGPHMHKSREIRALFQNEEASLEVHTAEELAQKVTHLLQDKPAQKCLRENAQKTAQAQSCIIESVFKHLKVYIP